MEDLQDDVTAPAPSLAEVVRDKLRDVGSPGFLAEFDPEEAALAGAFKDAREGTVSGRIQRLRRRAA